MWDRTGPVRHTWTHGLHVASLMATLLDDRRVNLVCFHNAYGGSLFPALLRDRGVFSDLKVEPVQDLDVEPFARSAAGWVMSIFGMAMNDMTQLTRLHFADAPEIVAPEVEALPAVAGWIFSHGQTERVLLINFAEHPLRLATGELAQEGVTFRQFFQEPIIHIVREEMMDQRHGHLGEELTLPPFSLTLVNSATEFEQMPDIPVLPK